MHQGLLPQGLLVPSLLLQIAPLQVQPHSVYEFRGIQFTPDICTVLRGWLLALLFSSGFWVLFLGRLHVVLVVLWLASCAVFLTPRSLLLQLNQYDRLTLGGPG